MKAKSNLIWVPTTEMMTLYGTKFVFASSLDEAQVKARYMLDRPQDYVHVKTLVVKTVNGRLWCKVAFKRAERSEVVHGEQLSMSELFPE